MATATNVEALQSDTVLYKTSLRSWAHNVMILHDDLVHAKGLSNRFGSP